MGEFDDVPAARANLHPVIAAPVQEKEGLFSCFQPFFEGIDQFIGKMGESARSFEGFFHVDDPDGGESGVGRGPCFQRMKLVFADFRIVTRLDGRGGASEKNRAVFEVAPHDGDIPPLIRGGFVALLIGVVVLFVDDDQPEILRGTKNGRTGSDDDARFPLF